jgi:Acyl carrier protein phosphodiesterase
METLLKIQASLFGAQGQSTQLADRFIEHWHVDHPQGRVIVRDLNANPVPHLTLEDIQAFGANPADRTPAQQAIVNASDALIAELKAADIIVFAVPMYNFSVPSTLRAYFDHIARKGVTFRYTEHGPEGLLKGKKTYVFISRGGIYPESADTQIPYLKQFLGFIGLKDIEIVVAHGLDMGPESRERALTAAHERIAELIRLRTAA